MAYITYEQYIALYGESPVPETEFPVYAAVASDLIDAVTQYRIEKAGGLSVLPAGMQALIQKAAAAQTLYILTNGLETVTSGQSGAGFTVGKVHIDGGSSGANGMTGAQLMISPLARTLLEQTGLMYRGTSVLYCHEGWGWPIC